VSADGHPVPDIDGANGHQQPDDLVLVEEAIGCRIVFSAATLVAAR
jgi:hypothetical protein